MLIVSSTRQLQVADVPHQGGRGWPGRAGNGLSLPGGTREAPSQPRVPAGQKTHATWRHAGASSEMTVSLGRASNRQASGALGLNLPTLPTSVSVSKHVSQENTETHTRALSIQPTKESDIRKAGIGKGCRVCAGVTPVNTSVQGSGAHFCCTPSAHILCAPHPVGSLPIPFAPFTLSYRKKDKEMLHSSTLRKP